MKKECFYLPTKRQRRSRVTILFQQWRRGSVTGYQVALDYCLDLVGSFELKVHPSVKRKLARSSFILMQV